jgi:hypothetical protein
MEALFVSNSMLVKTHQKPAIDFDNYIFILSGVIVFDEILVTPSSNPLYYFVTMYYFSCSSYASILNTLFPCSSYSLYPHFQPSSFQSLFHPVL